MRHLPLRCLQLSPRTLPMLEISAALPFVLRILLLIPFLLPRNLL